MQRLAPQPSNRPQFIGRGVEQRETLGERDLALPDQLELAELRTLQRDIAHESARAAIDERELLVAGAQEPFDRGIGRNRLAHILYAAAVELAPRIGQEKDASRLARPRRDVAQGAVDVAPHRVELAFEENARPFPQRPAMAGRAAAIDYLALDRLEAIERPLAQGHEAR